EALFSLKNQPHKLKTSTLFMNVYLFLKAGAKVNHFFNSRKSFFNFFETFFQDQKTKSNRSNHPILKNFAPLLLHLLSCKAGANIETYLTIFQTFNELFLKVFFKHLKTHYL
ncbi:hypothetical protein, partial [Joostella sp. CR20]|uniref:hypothetical protein n=1 Tax=Joostella sp. CR20 TaxID=2804312 RepID=UPI00313C8806